jgi:hypothetical protein
VTGTQGHLRGQRYFLSRLQMSRAIRAKDFVKL